MGINRPKRLIKREHARSAHEARASATHCFCPPERTAGHSSRRSYRPVFALGALSNVSFFCGSLEVPARGVGDQLRIQGCATNLLASDAEIELDRRSISTQPMPPPPSRAPASTHGQNRVAPRSRGSLYSPLKSQLIDQKSEIIPRLCALALDFSITNVIYRRYPILALLV